MDDSNALFLLILIGFSVPLLPLAIWVGRQSIADWKDLILVAAVVAILSYVTWPAYRSLAGMTTPLVPPEAGQGALPVELAGVGVWLIAEFCLAGCLLAYYKRRR